MANTLQIDYKIDKIIKKIQSQIRDENGKPLSYETIVNIIESQIDSTVDGMRNGDSIVWKYFGTFQVNVKRIDMLNNQYIKKGKTPTIFKYEDRGLSEKIIFRPKNEK